MAKKIKIRSVEDLQSYGERELIEEIQTLDSKIASIKDSARSLVEYLYSDERKNYEEMYDIELEDIVTSEELEKHNKAHIFNDVVKVEEWLSNLD